MDSSLSFMLSTPFILYYILGQLLLQIGWICKESLCSWKISTVKCSLTHLLCETWMEHTENLTPIFWKGEEFAFHLEVLLISHSGTAITQNTYVRALSAHIRMFWNNMLYFIVFGRNDEGREEKNSFKEIHTRTHTFLSSQRYILLRVVAQVMFISHKCATSDCTPCKQNYLNGFLVKWFFHNYFHCYRITSKHTAVLHFKSIQTNLIKRNHLIFHEFYESFRWAWMRKNRRNSINW